MHKSDKRPYASIYPCKALAAVFIGFVLGSIPVQAAVILLKLDFNRAATPTEAGFTGQNTTSQLHAFTFDAGPGTEMQVDIAGVQGNFDFNTNTGTAHPDLFRDFYFDNFGLMTLTLSGLGISAGSDYDITFWSFYGAEARNTIITPTAGTTGSTLGPIAFVTNPTSLSDNAASGTFTSNGSGILTFDLTGSGGRPAINGFEISTDAFIARVPEPNTFALFILVAAVIMRRRRNN